MGSRRPEPAGRACWRGWFSGHSGRRSAGGLILAQLAKVMVRDHRNSPLLLVTLNEPYTEANQPMYATMGSTPASSAAPALSQPARVRSR